MSPGKPPRVALAPSGVPATAPRVGPVLGVDPDAHGGAVLWAGRTLAAWSWEVVKRTGYHRATLILPDGATQEWREPNEVLAYDRIVETVMRWAAPHGAVAVVETPVPRFAFAYGQGMARAALWMRHGACPVVVSSWHAWWREAVGHVRKGEWKRATLASAGEEPGAWTEGAADARAIAMYGAAKLVVGGEVSDG